jgi:outer membrane protein
MTSQSILLIPASILLLMPFCAAAQNPPTRFTIQEARALALKNHPQVLSAQDLASEADQVVVESRAAYYPNIQGDVTASQAPTQTRIGAGFLSDSRLFNRFGQGVTISQLITDSGRTPNLVSSSRLEAQASQQNLQATRYDVLLRVSQAYYEVLRAQALVKVSTETVAARQLLVDQVTALAKNNLRSQLDVGLADTYLAEAKLLQIRSEDRVRQAFADLTQALGAQQVSNYNLVEEVLPPSPPPDPETLVTQAIAQRPEAVSLHLRSEAAYKYEAAEKDLSHPTVSLTAVAGALPFINQQTAPRLIPNYYEGAAVNVEIPIFNGHLFSARRAAAHYRALAADQRLRDIEQRIARDVRSAWANSVTAYQQLDVTAQLLRRAALAMQLADGRYKLGLSSIVELTQAQLNLTQAEIENTSAKYDYQTQYAVLQYAIGSLR